MDSNDVTSLAISGIGLLLSIISTGVAFKSYRSSSPRIKIVIIARTYGEVVGESDCPVSAEFSLRIKNEGVISARVSEIGIVWSHVKPGSSLQGWEDLLPRFLVMSTWSDVDKVILEKFDTDALVIDPYDAVDKTYQVNIPEPIWIGRDALPRGHVYVELKAGRKGIRARTLDTIGVGRRGGVRVKSGSSAVTTIDNRVVMPLGIEDGPSGGGVHRRTPSHASGAASIRSTR